MVVNPKQPKNRCPEGRCSRIISVLMAIVIALVPWVAVAHTVDLTTMSLEELMEIEITSASRKPQKLSDTAAAAFIITQEDIRRSGVTTIMDALRMAPGVQVAQVDGNKWAITARGLNGRFATKLLVLIDGRTIYSPFFFRCVVGGAGHHARRHRADRGGPGARRQYLGRQRRERHH